MYLHTLSHTHTHSNTLTHLYTLILAHTDTHPHTITLTLNRSSSPPLRPLSRISPLPHPHPPHPHTSLHSHTLTTHPKSFTSHPHPPHSQAFESYFTSDMPWLAVDFAQRELKELISMSMDVEGRCTALSCILSF